MKYIRTKDGKILKTKGMRFIQASHSPNYYVYVGTDDKSHYIPYIVSDTIEELCDEFVIKYYSNVEKRYKYLHFEKYKELKNYYWDKDDEYFVYGAIWTDKGLTYIAKLNDKGELELL